MSSEEPLDRFYSSGDPERFQSEIRDLVRKRLETELQQSRIEPTGNETAPQPRRRRSPLSAALLVLSLLLALGGAIFYLLRSAQQNERLQLSATLLHSTEGKLIEALAVKAGSDQGYVDKLLLQYRKRIEARKRAEAERAHHDARDDGRTAFGGLHGCRPDALFLEDRG